MSCCTTLDQLPLGQLAIASRLPLSSVASLASTSSALRDRVDGADGHWLERLQRQFGAEAAALDPPSTSNAASAAPPTAPAAAPPTGKEALRHATICANRLCTQRPTAVSYARSYQAAAPTSARIVLSRSSCDYGWAPHRLAVALDSLLWFSQQGRRRFSGPAGHTAWVDCLIEVAPGRWVGAGGGAWDAQVRGRGFGAGAVVGWSPCHRLPPASQQPNLWSKTNPDPNLNKIPKPFALQTKQIRQRCA